ncbi:MAG: M20/M25/M40 family metallo-hydrolase [Labilithrix sp.]|nr:M20/M25/M40 family metallo-hydrolase [Labilithrix sp.]
MRRVLSFFAWVFALLVVLPGCAVTTSPEIAAPTAARRWYDAVDWKKAGDEATEVLRGYLRVDTTNPPGNETRGAEYMGAILAREHIPYEIVEYAPGRGNLIARLDSERPMERPLCLLSHIDVVTAEAEKWPKDKGPLSGALDEKGYIWGRGALDMKGLGALELMTMVWLKRLNVPLRRHVILLAVAAEESDSGGVQFIVDKHWGKIGCSHSVNEGGMGIHDLLVDGQTVYAISVAEKGVLWLKMTAHGEAGHGSTPVPGRAPERLLRALDRLSKRDPDPVIHPSLYELAARVGEQTGGLKGFVLRRPTLVRKFVMGKLLENPPARATLVDTVNVTGFEGKKEPNVIPSEVSAILDCRVLPGTRPIDLYVELRRVVDDPNVTFEILDAMEAGQSTWEDPFFSAMARHAVDGRANVVAGPALSPGYTDSLFLRKKGVRTYGFVPFEVNKEEMNGFHGRDERVSVANVHRGLRALFRAVVDVSVAR